MSEVNEPDVSQNNTDGDQSGDDQNQEAEVSRDQQAEQQSDSATEQEKEPEAKEPEKEPEIRDKAESEKKAESDKKPDDPALKVPDGPEGYEIPVPEGMTEIKPLTELVRKVAAEHKLPQGVITDLANGWNDYVSRADKAAREAQDKALEELAKEYGSEWDNNIDLAARVVRIHGTPGLSEYLEASQAYKNPDVIRLFVKVGKLLAEDKFVDGDRGETGPADEQLLDFSRSMPG